MNEAVFISDLHLHPNDQGILQRFQDFVLWARHHTRSIYILGDFFHVWAGDDTIDSWGRQIARNLAQLSQWGISVYLMCGNRDFLLGQPFYSMANVSALPDPSCILLGQKKILLTHGDRYCTADKNHQRLRFWTRNFWFPRLFQCLPRAFRQKIVATVRVKSQQQSLSLQMMDVVKDSLITHLQQVGVETVIHGHTHRPGLTVHHQSEKTFQQYVLSDWDSSPQILCYNENDGFFYQGLIS